MPIDRPATWATMSRPSASGLLEQAEHLAPHLGVLVGLVEVHAHRPARPPSEVGHPRPLVQRDAGVIGRELEHAVAGAGERIADGQQLVGCRVGARHQLAVLRSVQRGAARGEPQRAGAQRLLHELGHPDGVVGRWRARWRRPARPSRRPRSGPWAIWAPTSSTLGCRSTASRYSGKLVHSHVMPSVMAEPGMSSTPSMSSISHSCRSSAAGAKPDAAVAHHDGGDAVPRARGDPRIPGDLRVVVRVDVDPAGRDAAGRRRRAPGRPTRCWRVAGVGDLDDAIAVDDDVGRAGRPRPSRRRAGRCAPRGQPSPPLQQTDWRRAAAARKARRP